MVLRSSRFVHVVVPFHLCLTREIIYNGGVAITCLMRASLSPYLRVFVSLGSFHGAETHRHRWRRENPLCKMIVEDIRAALRYSIPGLSRPGTRRRLASRTSFFSDRPTRQGRRRRRRRLLLLRRLLFRLLFSFSPRAPLVRALRAELTHVGL